MGREIIIIVTINLVFQNGGLRTETQSVIITAQIQITPVEPVGLRYVFEVNETSSFGLYGEGEGRSMNDIRGVIPAVGKISVFSISL